MVFKKNVSNVLDPADRPLGRWWQKITANSLTRIAHESNTDICGYFS